MDFRIEIKGGTAINQRGYKDKMYGEQQAALHMGQDFPLVFRVNVEVGNEYKPGWYDLDPSSFVTDQYGNLGIKRPKLIAAKAVGK